MTQRQVIRRLAKYLTIGNPAPLTGRIAAVQGNLVMLDFATGTEDQWEGGMLTMNDGVAKYDQVPICSNTGNTVWIANTFDPAFMPKVNDGVTLSGGPLGIAVVEQFEVDAVVAEVNAGKKYF